MKLPDDFWSVNEDEPGIGGVIVAFLVVILGLAAIFGWIIITTVPKVTP